MQVVLIVVPIMDSLRGGKPFPIAQDLVPTCPTLAIYLLASVLREHGHDVSVVDLTAEGTNNIGCWVTLISKADLVGITATSLSWPTALSVVEQIRKAEIQVPIVVGGVHPTMFADYILRAFPAINFVIRGEGEKALVALCQALERPSELANVPNLSWSKGEQIVHNPPAPLLTIDEWVSLPLPAYDLLPDKVYPTFALQSSRGCSFNCSFCSTTNRRSYRALPPLAFVDILQGTLSLVGDRVPTGVVQLVDDEWSLDWRRAVATLREIERRGINVKLIYDSRANDFLHEEFAEAVAPYTEQFLVGAESGYDEGLARIGKGTTVEKIERCAQVLVKYGIAGRAVFSFILGLPWEGKEEVLKTVRFASELALKYGVQALLQWYCQIPGSLLWDESWRRGDVTPAMYDEFGFFRNLYLFKTGVRLSPGEIWEVMNTIATCHSLVVLFGRDKMTMNYRPPAAIELYYPPWLDTTRPAPGDQLIARIANVRAPDRGAREHTKAVSAR
jgi:anaerobic magnesium-protoporphyrin IX monomethyl ester cyclase